MKAFALAILSVLAACSEQGAAVGRMVVTPPSQLDPEARAQFDALPLFSTYGGASLCGHIRSNVFRRVPADIPIYTAALRRNGLSSRDASLILAGQFGTGESFTGLMCGSGEAEQVNKAFYPGTGNQWQVVMPGPTYVYLEGNGEPGGMHITAWN